MVYQPASVLSRDVDVALVTKGRAVLGKEDERQKLLRHDTTTEKPNIRSSKLKSFKVSLVFSVEQPVRVLFILFFFFNSNYCSEYCGIMGTRFLSKGAIYLLFPVLKRCFQFSTLTLVPEWPK